MSATLYGEIIEIGPDGRPISPDIILAYRSGEKQGVIQNVQAFTHANHMMNAPEITFNVHKGDGENICGLWEEIRDFKLVYIPRLGVNGFNPWFELSVTLDDGDDTIKHCQGVHVHEAELSQLILNGFEANTESDIARDDYVPTVLYDPSRPDGSLLHRIIRDKASHYSIRYVDDAIANKQRTFSWNGTSILDALNAIASEIECIFVYGKSDEDDGMIHRTISAYDLNDYCMNCGERGTFVNGACTKCGSTYIRYGYGEDTGIFINYENFAENLNYSSNKDSVKNCFRLVAGDDLMTATAINLNPSGSQYIWYLSDAVRADMSSALRDRLANYDAMYESYENSRQFDIPQNAITAYNNLVNKYRLYDNTLTPCPYPIIGYATLIDLYYKAMNLYNLLKTSLAPQSEHGRPTSAEEQILTLNPANLSPLGVSNAATISATTVNSVLLNYARVYVDTSLYRVSIEESEYSNRIWTGRLKITSYDDEDDTATTSTLVINITDAEPEYLRCQIERAMKKSDSDASTMVALFEKDDSAFRSALHFYSVDNLNLLANLARGCLDVLIEHGQATPDATMYQSMYLKYYNKSEYIQNEIRDRETELLTLRGSDQAPTGVLDYIDRIRKGIAAALDMRAFLGETLWSELCSYRREDTYQNDNFVSDGLSDTELIAMAQEFLDYARIEIVKSATLQHTISCDLNNFLLVREHDVAAEEKSIITHDAIRLVTHNGMYIVSKMADFAPINFKFDVGNWLHVEIDGTIYKLRMTDYEINYDDLQSIMVDFSDVTYGVGAGDDLKSLLSMAHSMTTSYSATQRQANKGNAANEQIINMVSNGLDLTNKRIINSAANQTLLVDDTGMLMRARNEYDDDYSQEQVKIINHGLYYTNDNWRTVQAGIGKFICYDIDSGTYVEDYGLIARKIVGNIIIGNDLGIYSTGGFMTMNQDGFTITSDATNVNQNLFTLRRKNQNGTYTKYIYVDNNGHIRINGEYVQITATENLPTYVGNVVDGAISDMDASIDQTYVFNRLTNNGQVQGIFLENGKLYINADYIKTGHLAVSRITGTIGNTSSGWGIDFSNGTMSIGTLAVGKITGSISNGGWGIDFSNGTMSIGTLSADNIAAGAITANKIAANAVTADKITANAVTADKIAANAVTADKITANAITSAKIAAENITADKIAANAVTADKIEANAVTADKIAANAIAADKIAAGAIVAEKIASGAISAEQIAAGAVNAEKIASGAITADKIAAGTITADMIQSGTMSADRIEGGTLRSIASSGSEYDNMKLQNGSIFFYKDSATNASIRSRLAQSSGSGGASVPYMSITAGKSYIDIYGDIEMKAGNVNIKGGLTATGTKSRVVSTEQYSDRLLYCYETPSPMFGDIGEGVIGEDGLCYITLDAVFAQTIATSRYQVFLQTYGDGHCWVCERNGVYFVVEGTPGLAFGWEIKAKQRDYDQLRLDRKDSAFTPTSEDYGAMAAQYINNINLGRIEA